MAHRGPLREVFGILCMAVLIRKTTKKDVPPATTVYIETVTAVDDYFSAPNITVIAPTSLPPAGYLPSILSFLLLALSVLGNELLDSIFFLALHNVLLPLLRIGRRWSVAIITSSWRRVRGRVTGGKATGNTYPLTDDKVNESSPSLPSQTTTASATSDGPANAHEVDKSSQSAVQQTIKGLSDENGVWSNDEDLDPSSAKIFDNAPMPSTRSQVFAAFREQLGRKDKRINNKLIRQKRALAASQPHRENMQLRQKAIENTKLSTANKRLERQVLSLEMEQQSANKRLERQVLSLEMEQQSSVQEARNVERAAARQREKRLVEEKDAANNRASNAISQASYDSLKTSFNKLRDQFKEAQEGKKAAEDELRAERAKTETLSQQESESTATGTAVPSEDNTRSLEKEALARDEAVRDAEASAQEARTKAQDAEAKAKEADTKFQQAEAKAQEAEAKVQEVETQVQEAETKLQEANTKFQEAEVKAQESETRIESAINRAQDAELKAKVAEGRIITVQQESDDSKHQLEEKLQRAEEALEKAGNEAEGPSNQELYQQGYQAAVSACQAEAQDVIDREVSAAVTRRNAEVLAQFNTEVASAVTREKEPLLAELNAANERATTAESRANSADASLKEAQSSYDSIQEKASEEWKRAEEMRTIATDEYNRAEKAEEEVSKYKQGKANMHIQIRGHLDEISRLKRLIPANAALMAAEMDSATRDRQRAQALMEEITARSYDWETKQVLKKLLGANDKIIELECMLKDPKTQSNQIEFLKVLLDATIDQNQYMNLHLPMRQVIVKQCRAVNGRLDDLKTIINKSQRPKTEELLFEIYKVRGDEEACYDDDDPEPEPSSDEDEDEYVTSPGAQESAPRRLNLPTSRRARPATVPQVAETPLPVDARVQNDLKRKGFPNDEQERSIDPVYLDPQLTAMAPGPVQPPAPVQHYASPNPFAPTATPSQLEQAFEFKPTGTTGPRQKPQLTASERQRYVPNPESEATSSAQETAAPPSIPGATNFSFSMPKNIASGIRPHVHKYTRLSGMTNIVRSRRQSSASDAEP